MFRKATMEDIKDISRIYDEIHAESEAGRMSTEWVRGIYPSENTARLAVECGDMFVEEEDGRIVAAARINQEQVAEYENAVWQYEALPEQVMVLHTLVVSPKEKGRGFGSKFVSFYEDYARKHNCPYLRMDTSIKNLAARTLYQKLGYKEVSVVSSQFNGLGTIQLVCLEKKLSVLGTHAPS